MNIDDEDEIFKILQIERIDDLILNYFKKKENPIGKKENYVPGKMEVK